MWTVWLSPIEVFQLGRSVVVCCACESHFLSRGITFEMCVKLSLGSLQTQCVTYDNLWRVINTDTNWGDCSWPWQLLFRVWKADLPLFAISNRCIRFSWSILFSHNTTSIYIVNNTYFWLHVSVLSNRPQANISYMKICTFNVCVHYGIPYW